MIISWSSQHGLVTQFGRLAFAHFLQFQLRTIFVPQFGAISDEWS